MRPHQWYSTWAILAMIAAPLNAQARVLTRSEEREFGRMPDGTAVTLFTLRNERGMEVRVMTYGAILNAVEVPDRNGSFTNVVLGASSLGGYLNGFQTPAAIIGRVANRIANARFTLNGVEYKLAANAPPHHIHGGVKGFGLVVWKAHPLAASEHASAVCFTYLSKDGEEGYPGTTDRPPLNLELIVTEAQRYGQSNPRPGHVQGVYLKNVQWENPDKPFVIAGLPTMRNYNNNVVEDVTFDHCRVAGRLLGNLSDADFQMEFAKDIKFIPATKMKKGILSKE